VVTRPNSSVKARPRRQEWATKRYNARESPDTTSGAVIGQDVLRYHQAVIDYATLALFLKEEPA
jgi:hypothetical protein